MYNDTHLTKLSYTRRPVITGTGLATEVIAERYKAGETVAELAKDYDRKEAEIEEAIRCDLKIAA